MTLTLTAARYKCIILPSVDYSASYVQRKHNKPVKSTNMKMKNRTLHDEFIFEKVGITCCSYFATLK